jgi:hypothetical protein
MTKIYRSRNRPLPYAMKNSPDKSGPGVTHQAGLIT